MKIRSAFFMMLMLCAVCSSADTIIDDFSTGQGPVTSGSDTVTGGMLGGTRYLHYNGDTTNYVEVTSGNLNWVYGSAGGDFVTIHYDGGTGDIVPDYTGLGGVNLGGADGFLRFTVNSSDHAELFMTAELEVSEGVRQTELFITAWTDEDYASSIVSVALPASGGLVDVYYSSFEQFGALGSADFSNIGALEIQLVPVDRIVGRGIAPRR